MAQYAGSDVFPASFEEVNDGTARDAASVNVGLESLANRTIYLKNRLLDLSSNITFAGNTIFQGTVRIENSLSIDSGFDILYNPPTGKVTSIVLSQLPTVNIQGDSGWTVPVTSGNGDVEVTASILNHFAYWYPQLPELTVTDVFCTITPASGHGGLPAIMPELTITFVKLSDGTFTPFSGTDTSATLLAYQQRHAFSASSINYAFNPETHKMNIQLRAETGANASGVFRVNGIRIAVKRFKYD